MDRDQSADQVPESNRDVLEEEVLAEQVRQIFALSFYGTIASTINSLIVFFVVKTVMPKLHLVIWLGALLAVTVCRIALTVSYRQVRARSIPTHTWKSRFLVELSVIGLVWGSLAFIPFSRPSITHEVFIAFVLGGMGAGAAATFSVLKEGYIAYAIPAMGPLVVRFLLTGDVVHYAMAGMLSLFGFLLWRISLRHYSVNRMSLLLRFENRKVIESLKRTKEMLLMEIDAKLKAEAELRVHQEQLERLVQERTRELIQANEMLKAQIEERKQAEGRLALAEKAGRVGVFDLDLITGRAFWSAQLEELFGLPHGGFEGTWQGWIKRLHSDDRHMIQAQLEKWMSERRTHVEFEYRFIHGDGGTRWMAASAQFTYLEDGTPARMIGTNVDSTGRKSLEEEIMHMAHHDMLTGLPNRRLFLNIVSREMTEVRRNRRKLALLFLDLDRFKEINDTFGHNTGDELLKEVSRRLRGSIRESDIAARVGGDEFNVVLVDIVRSEDITPIARKIMDSFKNSFYVAGYQLEITASIGISVYPDDSEDMMSLFKYADIAMYHAKDRGRNAFQFYNADINIRSIERIRFESCLRRALTRGEFLVHYQPQVVVGTGQIIGAEALVRWERPNFGFLESKAFIPAAESIGFITAIDEWVLRTACTQFKAWMDSGYRPPCVAVNFSSRIFQDPDFVRTVLRILDETGLPPDHLEMEITESIAMDDIERTIVILKELTGRGISVSIDDFGTGYSSLNYLKRLPIQRLKIDQSFVKDIATDADDRAIIQAVTSMAHNMKISVLAEGVETEEQRSFLHAANCDDAQGFLFGRSLPAEEFKKLISSSK